jgi:hypothetical protein
MQTNTVLERLEAVISIRFSRSYRMYSSFSDERKGACVEAGLNTSTVTLRVVRGDEKGSLKFETVKYGHESHTTRTRE